MLASNSNQEEEIVIVKKIEGPSVDDEYDFRNDDIFYDEESPRRSKIKTILPLMALLVGGGAFYLINNSDKLVTSKVETITKASESTLLKKPIEEKEVAKKEEKNAPVIVKKSEPKVEKKAPTHYIEALAMPTVVEKEKKVEKVAVVEKTQVKELTPKKIIQKQPKVKEITVKKVSVKKRVPSLVAHYEKIKPRIVHVRKGDTLAILAKRFYGNEMEFKRIVRANRRLKSSKTALRLGEKLVIPRKSTKRSRRYIIVEKGNTLALIAKKFYGNVKAVPKIVQANYKIKSSRSMLHLGQKVYVPQ